MFFLPFLAVLVYALALGTLSSTIAFVDPRARADWAPFLVSALFPIGDVAFFASQFIGGSLTAAAGLFFGNLGAAVPLFIAGVAMGFVHGGLIVAIYHASRWAIRRIKRESNTS
jgi:hypothetical protein